MNFNLNICEQASDGSGVANSNLQARWNKFLLTYWYFDIFTQIFNCFITMNRFCV